MTRQTCNEPNAGMEKIHAEAISLFSSIEKYMSLSDDYLDEYTKSKNSNKLLN